MRPSLIYWGEFIDLTNGKGSDPPVARWFIGEDLPTGPIRYMRYPKTYNPYPSFSDDPDRMTSSFYRCGLEDNGGVHNNSGVANKTAYLMTDGDIFNGIAVGGLGITKVAKIF